MKKLNNKGYMLVEIIIASVIALTIAYFLIDITIKMVNSNNDYYIDSLLTADKNVITKEIMDDFNNSDLILTKVTQENNEKIKLTFKDKNGLEKNKELIIEDGGKEIRYGDYARELSNKVNVGAVYIHAKCTDGSNLDSDGNCLNTNNEANLIIELPAYTNYSSENYGVKLIIPYITEEVELEIPNPTTSSSSCGANAPELTNGLIPVYYNETNKKWLKADQSNNGDNWYNYCSKKWANAVLVTSTNRNTYNNAAKGTEIKNEDILAFYVWIPRYKYKLWNIGRNTGFTSAVDYYGARITGIDIVFENETESTGTVSCTYDFSQTESTSVRNEDCGSATNGEYYTHPAFTFGSNQIKGFWMGKFEMSTSDGTYEYGGSSSTYNPKILPNKRPWAFNPVTNFYLAIRNMQKSSNIYGLTTSRTVADSHMITNMEWGASAYFAYSKYGVCSETSCNLVAVNNTYFKTGMSAGAYRNEPFVSSRMGTYEYNQNKVDINTTTGVLVNPTISNTSSYPWTNSGGVWQSGGANSSTSGTNSVLTLNFTLSNSGLITFDYSVSCGINQHLSYSIDKGSDTDYVSSGWISGTSLGTELSNLKYKNAIILLEAGTYTLTIQFYRNANFSDGLDQAFIKNIKIFDNARLGYTDEYAGQLASTTGNIYGVYDMSGGALEYTMSNMSSTSGRYTYYASSAGSNFSYSSSTSKYITTYAYGTQDNGNIAYFRSRLGDATGELIVSPNIGWNGERVRFLESEDSWFERSGYGGDGDGGIFWVDHNNGVADGLRTTRPVLIVF